jgi:ParB/RepB/Spo0J family partition protein
MSESTTAVLDIDAIEMSDGFNPRTDFDEVGLAELEASIRQSGFVTALTVRPNGGERFVLIAGERRLIAAKRAGLKRVPVLIREDDGALAASIAENLIRADLNPIEEATALRRLGEAEKLGTHKELAARVGKSAAYVSERLRLLALPKGVQRHVAGGKVPVEAERELRKVAKVSPRIAECACELVARGDFKGRDLVTRFDEVLVAASEARFDEMPTMIDPGAARLSAVQADAEKRHALAERYCAARPWEKAEDPVIRLGEAEVDAARAAGCLIEHRIDDGGWVSTLAFITDRELAADLAERAIERIEKEAAKRAKEEAKWRARRGGSEEARTPEQEKDARKAEREEAKKAAADARRFNEDLGGKLLRRRGGASRKEHSLARAKALAAVVLADNDGMAGRGLRLVLPHLREVEVKTLKFGGSRERVSYADREQCAEYLAQRIDAAGSSNEVLELLADGLIAAMVADQAAVPQSSRVHWCSPARDKAEKLLAADIKSVHPRRSSARK